MSDCNKRSPEPSAAIDPRSKIAARNAEVMKRLELGRRIDAGMRTALPGRAATEWLRRRAGER